MLFRDNVQIVDHLPRLPLEGSLDLTYRCNNNCRHCWLRQAPGSSEKVQELTFREIRGIVDEARALGCREWNISGGEPMLRPDFAEIFEYITSHSASYRLNTNGTLINPEIAGLMRRRGSKMVAIYGADAEVHDHVTRNPGSFDATMAGIASLKEAGAGFTVQVVPMQANYHQYKKMQSLARSLSPHTRVGAAWLYMSASGDAQKNREIAAQRLPPAEVIRIDRPAPDSGDHREACQADDNLFAACIAARRDFHIDPTGQMSFCSFVKDPALRYDLRSGSFEDCWENFIPSLADRVKGGREFLENCGSCDLRSDCRWCPVYGYLEHRRFSAPVKYLCRVAEECRKYKENWNMNRRYYEIGGITLEVESDLPITDQTFDRKFRAFERDGPGEDVVRISHHFGMPDIMGRDPGTEVYRKPPWAIYRKGKSWVYHGISPDENNPELFKLAVFSDDYSRGHIYNKEDRPFSDENHHSLTLFPTDQIVLAPLLARRQACYIHSSGVVMDGRGLLFVGHSEAGKSTTTMMLKDRVEILCDDRNIVRRWPEGFRLHGTWSHGDVPDVSSASAPLNAIFFLRQSAENRITPLSDDREIAGRLLSCLIRPMVTAEWWQSMIDLLWDVASEVPCYEMEFDKSGQVVPLIEDTVGGLGTS